MDIFDSNPKLRALDIQPVYYQGKQMWFLRDPLNLSDHQILVPNEMAPLFAFLDGTKNSKEIHHAFCHLTGMQTALLDVIEAIKQLDNACLLDNERSQQAIELQLIVYRRQSFRPPSLAGRGYPEDPKQLANFLDGFFEHGQQPAATWKGRGIISPHIDYQRGGPVYAQVWQQAAEAVASADLIIILGTDHNGGPQRITFTQKPYATPYGILPLDESLIKQLTDGLEHAFDEELHHRDEHSIELSAVWLHHILRKRGLKTKPMIPILIGSFHNYLRNGTHPKHNQTFNHFIQKLQDSTFGKKVLLVASIDLAHVGPNFGDPFAVQSDQKSEIRKYDRQLISSALEGDADKWFHHIAAVQDRHRICGFSPTYFLLRYLGPTSGTQIAYDQCPADYNNTSIVSICGLLID